MTCDEKYMQEHPDCDREYIVHMDCPSCYGYLDDPEYCRPYEINTCRRCWDREIPETDNAENKKENTVMSTTKKTKAELVEEIDALKKELEEIKNAEQYQHGANQLKAMHAAYMIAGFTDEQSFELVLAMLREGIKTRR